jgi:TolB-like protein
MDEFLERLRQRKLVQWAIAYVAGAFALLQGIDIVAQQFGWPEGVRRGITLALVVGFFINLILAWYHGERGAQQVTGTELLIIAAVLTLGGGVLWHFVPASNISEDKTRMAPNEARPSVDIKSIAVLPFENLSSDKENAYFTDGVQDEILTDLARIADLKVISRTSVMQYKSGVARNLREIGRQLGAAHVVEGSVQRSANKIRVNAQLIDARNDAHLWAETYDRDLADVFAIQSEIAKTIADQLQAKLSPAEKNAIEQAPTSDVIAFDQFSRARTLMLTNTTSAISDKKNLLVAIELLNSAVARDPSFYAAFCALVYGHDSLYSLYDDHTPARLAASEAALQRATELRPDDAQTHNVRASHLYGVFRDYKGALRELEAARAGLPNNPSIAAMTGFIMRRQGRHEEGIRGLAQAVALDPRNTYYLSQLSLSYQALRRYSDEKATLQRVVGITPDDIGAASNLAFVDFDSHGDTKPFHQFIDRLLTQHSSAMIDAAGNWFICALADRDWPTAQQALATLGNNPFWEDDAGSFGPQLGQGLLERARNDEAEARKAFAAARQEQEKAVQKQKDYAPPLCVLGLIDAALGNSEAALQEGRRAMELVPVEKDSLIGQSLRSHFALIAAWAGEKDLALQYLAETAPTFGGGTIASYGMLARSPFWDPVRSDPRFQKIVQSFAPKEAGAAPK